MTIDIWNNVLKLEQSKASEKKLIVVLPEEKFVPTVNGLAFYIKSILDNPLTSLSPETQTNLCDMDRRAATLIASSLNLFPFIFVLDEADDLNRPSAQVPMDSSQSAVITGFEIIRRALSYLIPGTNIFFLTLGTRSDVHDLSPPSRENSQRLMRRRFTPKPIILLSNTSTFSKQEYPLEKLTISQNVLKNPVFFKLLATLGHPLWASRSFEAIVPLAESKLQNGSWTTLDYVLCIWMIRAGLTANPMDLNTRTLIASHMATLFDLDEELARMIVFYPSDPILALGCRRLIRQMRGFDEKLFSMLENHFEAAQIDRGQVAECIGTMVVLLAIDDANLANKPCDSSNIGNLIEDMISMNPEFDSLWRKKSFILEPDADSNSNSSPTCSEFEGYRVCTVESFLETLLSSSKFAEIKNKLPPSTLLGIVNSSHAVKITRTGLDDIQFNRQDYHSMKLPTADNRLDDENCNLIDEALLKLGLIHQCCFFMPDRYFGYDLIIPVMLKDGNFTYIGIQFKAADVSISAPIDKMQARLHFVKCPVSDSNGCHSANCPRCSDVNVRNALKEKFSGIFANQISLLIHMIQNHSKRASNLLF